MESGIMFWVRIIGFVEGLSAFALMFVAMPMKYVFQSIAKDDFRAVGMFHGLLWVAYAIVATIAMMQKKINFKQYVMLALFSLFPIGPIIADRYVLKKNRIAEGADNMDQDDVER